MWAARSSGRTAWATQTAAGTTCNHWFNNSALRAWVAASFSTFQSGTCNVGVGSLPIGHYGTESLGDLHGPGTVSLSSGLKKSFTLVEGMRLRAEGTFTNVLDHTNLADPVLDLTNANFGQITQGRGSDFGGNRTGNWRCDWSSRRGTVALRRSSQRSYGHAVDP